jgi:hypothetical protein
MNPRVCRLAPAVAALVLLFAASPARANSMPINFLGPLLDPLLRWASIGIGAAGLAVSIALGITGFWVAKRVKLDSSRRVFARGFLGVAAVVFFALSAAFLALGSSKGNDDTFVTGLLVSIPLVLGAEFGIAGALYREVRRKTGSAGALALSIVSFAIAVLCALTFLGLLGTQVKSAVPGPLVCLAGAAGLVVASVRSYRRARPETVGAILKHGLWGWGAFVLGLVGTFWLTDAVEGRADLTARLVKAAPVLALGVLVAQGALTVWLLWRRWKSAKDKAALVLAVLLGIGSGLLALFVLFGALGTISPANG